MNKYMNETSPKSLKNSNSWVFQKFILELETFSNIKAVDVTLENVQYFNLWVSCLYTLSLLSLLINWVTTFFEATYRTMESRQSCKTSYMIRIKESDKRPF